MMKSLLLCGGAAIGLSAGSALGFVLDFESAGGYTTSVPEFTDGFEDYWIRTDGADHAGAMVYNGVSGDYYFAGSDLDGEGATLPISMEVSGIDISTFSSIQFSVDLAEDDDSSNQDWDLLSDLSGGADDIVSFEYRIDGGGWASIFDVFAQNPTSVNGYSNGEPQVNGTAVTDTFATFGSALAGTGALLDLRITWDLNSGDEDLAIDNITITPTPGTIALLGLGGLAGLRRRRA